MSCTPSPHPTLQEPRFPHELHSPLHSPWQGIDTEQGVLPSLSPFSSKSSQFLVLCRVALLQSPIHSDGSPLLQLPQVVVTLGTLRSQTHICVSTTLEVYNSAEKTTTKNIDLFIFSLWYHIWSKVDRVHSKNRNVKESKAYMTSIKQF